MKRALIFLVAFTIGAMAFTQTQNALNFAPSIFGSYKETVTVPGIDVNGNTTISAEAWCFLTNYGQPFSSIVVKETPITNCGMNYVAFILFLENSNSANPGLASFGLGDGTNFNFIVSTFSIPLNEWHHVAGTYDGTTIRVYVDGIERASMNAAFSLYDAGIEMNIGNKWNCTRRYLTGDIDEVRIWDDARTEQEIRDNMYRELPNPGSETDLIAYYMFNEVTGSTTYDSGPNGYNGQLGGYSFDGNITTAPTWVTSTAPIPYYTIANGNWDINNTWEAGQLSPVNDWSRVIINNDVHLNQNQTLKDLIINTGASLTIDPNYDLTMDGDIQNLAGNNGIVIKAGASGMGSLIHSTANIQATVEEYLVSESWHLVSSPVSNATIDTYFDIYLKEFKEPTNSWTYMVSPTNLPMNVAQGYSAWASNGYTGSTTVNYAGFMNAGDFALTSFSYTALSTATGWNLVGNPYPSPLQWNNSWTKTDIGEWACIHNNGNDECYNAADGTSWPNVGDMANGIIPSTQGFWVRATSASASMTIPQSERMNSNQAFYKDGSFVDIEQTVRLRVDGNNDFDVVLVQFTPSATNDFDARFDLEKRWGYAESPNIYSIKADDNLYSVDVLPEVSKGLVVPIGFEVGVSGLYTITTSELVGFSDDIHVVLEDIKEGKFIDLEKNSIYEFLADPADEKYRFNLLFKDGYNNIADIGSNDINIYSHDNIVYIQKPMETIINEVVVFNIMGQEVLTNNSIEGEISKLKIYNGMGYYLVKATTEYGVITKKVFIK